MLTVKVDPDSIVEEYKIKNTTIKICNTSYVNKTSEDIEKILKRIAAIGWRIVEQARVAGKDV